MSRCWSNRSAIVVARGTADATPVSARIPLQFQIQPSETLERAELPIDRLRGPDFLYVVGLLALYQQRPGDFIAARTETGELVAIGLMSYADRFTLLDRAAPSLYHPIAADECWTEAHYVLPEFRNQHILGAVLAAERAHLAQHGYARALAMIDTDNIPSLRAFGREGYEPTGALRRDIRRWNRLSTRFERVDATTDSKWRSIVAPPDTPRLRRTGLA